MSQDRYNNMGFEDDLFEDDLLNKLGTEDVITDEDAWLEELKVLAGMEEAPAKPAAQPRPAQPRPAQPRQAPQQPRPVPPQMHQPPRQPQAAPYRPAPGQQPRQNVRQAPPAGRPGQVPPQMRQAPRQVPPAGRPLPPTMRQAPRQMPPNMQGLDQIPAQPGMGEPQAPRKSHTGGLIFYAIFFAGILAFYLCAYGFLGGLQDWLVSYEAAQPTRKCQEVFTQYFEDPDWAKLYDLAGIQQSTYEGKDAFAAYMDQRVGDQELTYLETSAGLSKDKKYIVRLGKEKIASFTLTDKNQAEEITDIPDWQLGTIELFFQGSGTYSIETLAGCTTTVNGVALTEENLVRVATTKVEEYLPEGVTVPAIYTQQVTGLMTVPQVKVTDASGKELEVTYDEASHTFRAAGTETTGQVTQEMKDRALQALKTYAVYMSQKSGGDDKLSQYFERGTDLYKTLSSMERMWNQSYSSYELTDESVKDCVRYADDLFSARVSVKLHLVRGDGSEKVTDIDRSMFFRKSGDNWKCYDMTAVDVSEPVEKVRLTFKNGEETLQSELVDTSANQIQCPTVTAPEGQVFGGWLMEEIKDNGDRVMHLMLKPDASGKAPTPAGMGPMVLVPLFENAVTE